MKRGTILVVEDHPLNRELVVDLLEAAGYTVRQAADGRGLLARVQAERPDLILLNLQLPGVDGFTWPGSSRPTRPPGGSPSSR